MGKCKISCEVIQSGDDYLLTVDPDPATVDTKQKVQWEITTQLSDVKSVRITNIVDNSSTDIFGGDGSDPAKVSGSKGTKWKAKVCSTAEGENEDYTIYYRVTLDNGSIKNSHDPALNVRT